jgi:hypothetical protein
LFQKAEKLSASQEYGTVKVCVQFLMLYPTETW